MTRNETRTERAIRLYRLLVQRGSGSTSELAKDLEVPPNDVREDLKELGALMGVSAVGVNKHRRWVLDGPISDHTLAIMDHIALTIGRGATEFLRDAGVGTKLDRVNTLQHVPERQRQYLDRKFVVHGEPARRYDEHVDVLDDIIDALVRCRRLAFDYPNASTGELSRWTEFRPLTLVVYRRALYVMGLRTGRAQVFRLPVERICNIELGATFEYPTNWNPRNELEPSFGIFQAGKPERVVLRFSAERAHLVRVRRWHATQVLRELDDGRIELEMTTAGAELERFALEWGEHCEVVLPTSLRDSVRRALYASIAIYGIPSTPVSA